jgi:hypothetical protein
VRDASCLSLPVQSTAWLPPPYQVFMTKQNNGAQARLHLLDANRGAIAVMLARATAGGITPGGAVVIVLDQRDAVGRDLARAAAVKAGLVADAEAERVQGRGQIPTAIIAVPLSGARMLFAESHPEVERGLARSPGPRQVRIVVIAEGAAMLLHADVSPARSFTADDGS